MPETIITVQGHHLARFPAERATVAVTVQFDGPDREAAVAQASASADAVRAAIATIEGGVRVVSAGDVRTSSERPWSNDGAQLPLVHHASLPVTVEFIDLAAVNGWLDAALAIPGTTVQGVTWTLTERMRVAVTAEVRSRAVKDAVAKASIYAQALGLGTVTAIALADQGMLGDVAPQPGHGGFERAMAMKVSDGAPQLALNAEEVEIAAAVDARFVAS